MKRPSPWIPIVIGAASLMVAVFAYFRVSGGAPSIINGPVTQGPGSAGINNGTINNFNGAQRLVFNEAIAEELARRLPREKGIFFESIGPSRQDLETAGQYRSYLASHGFRIEGQTSMAHTVPMPDKKITITTDGPLTGVTVAPSAGQ